MTEPILGPETSSSRARSVAMSMSQPNYSAQGNLNQAKLISQTGSLGALAAIEESPTYAQQDIFDRDLERHIPREKVGSQRGQRKKNVQEVIRRKQINNVAFITIGGLVFVSIIAWFEALRTFYNNVFEAEDFDDRFGPTFRRLGFALLSTSLSIILVVLIYRNIIQ